MTDRDFGSKVFSGWRAAAGGAWPRYTRHAFVKALGDGSLPRSSFLHYLVQDYIFLVHFSRAWALAVVKSDSMSEMKIAAATVEALVNHEMQLHIQTCAKEGISETEMFSAAEASENMAYTRFVMDAGFSGDFLDLMAALAPCVLGYGDIGLHLAETASPDTPYREWIDTYSGEEYQDTCRTVAKMIDEAALARLGPDMMKNPRWNRLCDRFTKATTLEIGFWDMGLRGRL